MVRIALVRHGQTNWNFEGRMQGSHNIPLNDTGREQARQAAERLHAEGEHWDGVVSSSLDRAVETGRIMAEILGIPFLEARDDFVERDYGQLEGMDVIKARERFTVDGDLAGPGVETAEALLKRATAALDAVAIAHPVDGLLVTTHGTFTRVLADHLAGFVTPRISNGDSVHLEGEPGNWRITQLAKARVDATTTNPDRAYAEMSAPNR